MILVPANMSRFDFSPCNFIFFCNFWSLQELFSKTIFCRDLFKKQNILQEFFLQNGFSHHMSGVQIITKSGQETILKNKIFCRTKNYNFFLHGLKPK